MSQRSQAYMGFRDTALDHLGCHSTPEVPPDNLGSHVDHLRVTSQILAAVGL